MKKISIASLIVAGVLLSGSQIVHSHCEIPCGIYGDMTRITILREDISTVEKSMREIIRLSELGKPKPVDVNQVVRWVKNKEEHANKIQHIVTQYFMTQRVKPNKPDAETYVKQLTALHGLLLHAMKSKQTTDLGHAQQLRDGVNKFAAAYFSAEDLKHLNSHK